MADTRDMPTVAWQAQHGGVWVGREGENCYALIRRTDAERLLAERDARIAELERRSAELDAIGELIRTQDNRITESPIFAVQQQRREYGIDPDYGGTEQWIDQDGREADSEDEARAMSEEDGSDFDKDGWRQTGYIDRWEFVTACFTEQGCKDYLTRNGHNLHSPRIYAYGSFRNAEWQAVRKFLMDRASPPAPSEQHGEGS